MEENTTFPTTRAAGIRYGVILGTFSIAYFLILSMLEISMSSGIGKWASTPVVVLCIFLAHKYYKDNGNGFMTYGQGVGISFWLGLVSSVLSSVFTFVYIKFIDSSFIANILKQAEDDMIAKGQSAEQIEMAMPYVEMFTTPTMIFIVGLIVGIIFSVIFGLIVSIFTQKQDPQVSL